jgi:hypothetical protein
MKKAVILIIGIVVVLFVATIVFAGGGRVGFPTSYTANCTCLGVKKYYFDDNNYYEKSVCYGMVSACIIID